MFTSGCWRVLVLLLALIGETRANAVAPFSPVEESPVPQPVVVPPGTADCIARDTRGDFLGWADYSHCLIDQRTLSGLRRFDDVFGMQDTPAQANYALRAISEVTINDRGEVTPALRIRASVSLPRTSQRLSLIFENDRQDADPLRTRPASNDAALALRWLAVNLQRLRIDTDAGLRSGPDLFARARLRKTWAITENDQFRIFQSVRYSANEHLRATTETDISHVFSSNLIANVYHVFDARQNEATCPCWSRGLLLAGSLGDRATLSGGFGQDGQSEPNWHTESRYAWMRWRQGFLREWLFYEVEPRLTQTRLRDWDTLPSLTLRLEVRFGRTPSGPVSILEQIRGLAQQSGEFTTKL